MITVLALMVPDLLMKDGQVTVMGVVVAAIIVFVTYCMFFRKKKDRKAYINGLGIAYAKLAVPLTTQANYHKRQTKNKLYHEFVDRLVPKMGIATKRVDRDYFTLYDKDKNLAGYTRHTMWCESAFRLVEEAADATIKNWGGDKNRITHIITHSCTGWVAPGPSVHLINYLGLPSSTQRLECNFMGCFGGFTLMKMAKGLVESDPNNVVLAVAVECCLTQMDQVKIPDEGPVSDTIKMRTIQDMLFGDGSSGIIVSSDSDSKNSFEMILDGSEIVPGTQKTMTWAPHSHFDVCREHNSQHYQMTVLRTLPDTLKINFKNMMFRLLHEGRYDFMYAIHPGGNKIIKFCENALKKAGLVPHQIDTAYDVLKECGNLSSCTFFYVLDKIMARKTKQKDVLCVGFGPGLTLEYAVLKRVNDN